MRLKCTKLPEGPDVLALKGRNYRVIWDGCHMVLPSGAGVLPPEVLQRHHVSPQSLSAHTLLPISSCLSLSLRWRRTPLESSLLVPTGSLYSLCEGSGAKCRNKYGFWNHSLKHWGMRTCGALLQLNLVCASCSE